MKNCLLVEKILDIQWLFLTESATLRYASYHQPSASRGHYVSYILASNKAYIKSNLELLHKLLILVRAH